MRKLALPTTAAAFLLLLTSLWATPGTFRGIVIHGPDITPGWMFLKSANGQVRQKAPALSIVTGADVRVTAEQDKDGEWLASKIEILSLHGELPVEPSERSEDVLKT